MRVLSKCFGRVPSPLGFGELLQHSRHGYGGDGGPFGQRGRRSPVISPAYLEDGHQVVVDCLAAQSQACLNHFTAGSISCQRRFEFCRSNAPVEPPTITLTGQGSRHSPTASEDRPAYQRLGSSLQAEAAQSLPSGLREQSRQVRFALSALVGRKIMSAVQKNSFSAI